VLKALEGLPNVIQLVNFFYTVDSKERIVQNTVLEFCDGNLDGIISGYGSKQ